MGRGAGDADASCGERRRVGVSNPDEAGGRTLQVRFVNAFSAAASIASGGRSSSGRLTDDDEVWGWFCGCRIVW